MSSKSEKLEKVNAFVVDGHTLLAESNNLHLPVKSEETLRKLLTKREFEIIQLVSRGLRNKEIASAIGINVRTVDFHVGNILLKFGVNTRMEAVLKWVYVIEVL